MNKADLQRYNDAKMQLRTLVNNAVQFQNKTQNEILTERNKIVSGIFGYNKNTPRHLGSSLNSYCDGLYDLAMKDQTIFLYNIDGQMYKLGLFDQKDINLPVWNTLPRDQWDKLGNYGGTYWRKTLNVFSNNGNKD